MQLTKFVSRLEKKLLKERLQFHGGDIYKTSKSLRVHPATIYRKIQNHKLVNFWLECRKEKA